MGKMFRGVYTVTVTPFKDNGDVDEVSLREHINWLLDEGCVHGLIPTGSTGEFAFLNRQERELVAKITIDAVGGRVPVIVGTAACSTREAIENSKAAEAAGAQGVMVVSPYYGHLSQRELFNHFSELSKNINIPIMLYNNPGTSGSDILPETVARLADFDNIVAIKESTGLMQRVHELQAACGERIEVLCGCDTLPLEMFFMGVEAWIAAPSNAVPRQCVELYRAAVEEKDFERANALYQRLLPLMSLFEESGQYVQLNKAALEILGRPVGAPRQPLLPVDDEQKAKLSEMLGKIGN